MKLSTHFSWLASVLVNHKDRRFVLPTALSAVLGLGLLIHGAWQTSATYDEVTYLRVAANWWRTGDQSEITRMGSPITFWKLQEIPYLWLMDRTGHGAWLNDTDRFQPKILPWARLSGLWIWAAAWVVTTLWAFRYAGPRAMLLAAWVFTLSPNLLAHGGLSTMEMPLVATFSGACYLFWEYLRERRLRFLVASSTVAGLAFSVKYTAILLPYLLTMAWIYEDAKKLDRLKIVSHIVVKTFTRMILFSLGMLLTNLVITGFAMIPPSEQTTNHPFIEAMIGREAPPWINRVLATPLPQDWVGFVTQIRHQRSGGSSYLLGERALRGWRHYYLVAMIVKSSPYFLLMAAIAFCLHRRLTVKPPSSLFFIVLVGFMLLASLGSSRNYGVRYLLPIAPLAIVLISPVAQDQRLGVRIAGVCLIGMAVSVAGTHPNELTYFPSWIGGPVVGRHILSDSNFDWGQGVKSLVRLQNQRPEFRSMTFYYFGDVDPSVYGFVGKSFVVDAGEVQPNLPETLEAETDWVAVSASLEFGPWGPASYFDKLRSAKAVATTDDRTISIYSASAVR